MQCEHCEIVRVFVQYIDNYVLIESKFGCFSFGLSMPRLERFKKGALFKRLRGRSTCFFLLTIISSC